MGATDQGWSEADRALLARIARALEHAQGVSPPADLSGGAVFRYSPADGAFSAVEGARRAPLALLLEIDRQKELLLANTLRFAQGAPANNALLWGARGTGKSALIKSVHAEVSASYPALKLVEAPAAALRQIGALVEALSRQEHPAILFLDDLSFAAEDSALPALKPALDGSVLGPARLLVYATSNRRHVVARDPRENSDDLFWKDAAEDHLALSDRFGLWLGFHPLDQEQFLRIVLSYARHFALPIDDEALEREALSWSRLRAARSGRTAWQFIVDLAGRLDAPIAF